MRVKRVEWAGDRWYCGVQMALGPFPTGLDVGSHRPGQGSGAGHARPGKGTSVTILTAPWPDRVCPVVVIWQILAFLPAETELVSSLGDSSLNSPGRSELGVLIHR